MSLSDLCVKFPPFGGVLDVPSPEEALYKIDTVAEFQPFPKIGRISRKCTITEKIDGTNAQIFISDTGDFLTGSRNTWITPNKDNYGFSRWAHEHKQELMTLGPGRHYGEWWGLGIQRNYGLQEKRFSLFNSGRWTDDVRPSCCSVVPVLYEGIFDNSCVDSVIEFLRNYGSKAAPGFMKPEGIVLYHHATKQMMKKTLEEDQQAKGQN
jgi:hypothetical protein